MKFRIGIFSMVVSDFCGGMLTGERVYPAGAVADVAVEEFSDWFDGECPFVRHCPNSIDFHFLAPIIVIVVIVRTLVISEIIQMVSEFDTLGRKTAF